MVDTVTLLFSFITKWKLCRDMTCDLWPVHTCSTTCRAPRTGCILPRSAKDRKTEAEIPRRPTFSSVRRPVGWFKPHQAMHRHQQWWLEVRTLPVYVWRMSLCHRGDVDAASVTRQSARLTPPQSNDSRCQRSKVGPYRVWFVSFSQASQTSSHEGELRLPRD